MKLAAWPGVASLLAAAAAARAAPRSETAVLAGGCFWGMEAVFEHVKGVHGVVSGYAGGSASDANYDAVSSERTGHAEAVRISYDPAQISYAQLLQIFFTVAHDPTQVNRQGPDTGTSYRSAIFPQTADSRRGRARLHRQAQRRPRLQGADRDPHRAAAASIRPRPITRISPEAPLLSVHRHQRPPEGRGAAEATSQPLQSVSLAKLLKFHALFSAGATKGARSLLYGASFVARRWGPGHADDQSVR